MSLKIKMETITPEKAHQYLTMNNDMQRHVTASVVARYARAMKTGRWRGENGEAIKFDVRGHLRDGQHRLLAIIKANKAIPLLVVRGIKVHDFATLDTGHKRTHSNILQINGFKNCNFLSSVIMDLMLIEQGESDFTNTRHRQLIQSSEIINWAKKNSDVPEAVNRHGAWKGRHLLTPRIVVTTKAALSRWCDDAETVDYCDEFFDAVASGEVLGSPAHQLRERLIKSQRQRSTQLSVREKMALTLVAWRLWATNDNTKRVFWRTYGRNAQEFPLIHGVKY